MMGDAFRRRFAGLPNVRVIKGRFEDLEPHDCFVTAGNSFGIMTAGMGAVCTTLIAGVEAIRQGLAKRPRGGPRL